MMSLFRKKKNTKYLLSAIELHRPESRIATQMKFLHLLLNSLLIVQVPPVFSTKDKRCLEVRIFKKAQ